MGDSGTALGAPPHKVILADIQVPISSWCWVLVQLAFAVVIVAAIMWGALALLGQLAR